VAEQDRERRRHLLVYNTSSTESFTSPRTGRQRLRLPQRDRQEHATTLRNQLQRIAEKENETLEAQRAFGLNAGNGLYIQFESDPEFDLAFESLEDRRQGIELLLTKTTDDGRTIATVFVPEGRLEAFFNKITGYQEQNTEKGNPKHDKLVSGIASIRMAVLEALWTDDPELLPTDDATPAWWEVWIRVSNIVDYETFLRQHAEALELTVHNEVINFLDRSVLLVNGTKEQMSHSMELLAGMAELRSPKVSAEFFAGMGPEEQAEWIEEAANRIEPPGQNAPSVCLLDTGLNRGHPLLTPVSTDNDLHTYHPDWGAHDHHGHGTEMAGLAAFSDLTSILESAGPIPISHRLESVKILPPTGGNPKHLYGAITNESVNRVEAEEPRRQRIFSMAVTSTDDRDRGRPSSWSAAIDSLASGMFDDYRRLFILSAGNTEPADRHLYPDSNLTDTIHDPGQSWNALTVGACTEKAELDPAQYPGWQIVAPVGDISPASCTSTNWERKWPIKPDIVMEGGNCAIDPIDGNAYDMDPLRLLTTGHEPLRRPLVTSGDTSAACAQIARLAAMLQAAYSDFWPETIRALLVHTAEWTPAMLARFDIRNRAGILNLLRYCGFGVPNEENLFWSASNSLTLIAQDSLQPFNRERGKAPKTRDINLHTLPWPLEVLQDLGETEVELRVTLSYFIEPNPGERGWKRRYSYASHGLRFDVKTASETPEEFRRRVNKAARDEEHGVTSSSDASRWRLGPDLRGLGSIHSDRWTGTAADLATRGYIAVWPVLGWWKERPNLERWGNRARYSLIASIHTPPETVDIYTPVFNQITVEIPV